MLPFTLPGKSAIHAELACATLLPTLTVLLRISPMATSHPQDAPPAMHMHMIPSLRLHPHMCFLCVDRVPPDLHPLPTRLPPLHDQDVVAKHGKGTWVWTTDGRKFLDMASGIGVTSTGHCHPAIVKAVQEQVGAVEGVLQHGTTIGREEFMVNCSHGVGKLQTK